MDFFVDLSPKIVTEMIRVLYLLHKRLVLVLKVSDLQWEQWKEEWRRAGSGDCHRLEAVRCFRGLRSCNSEIMRKMSSLWGLCNGQHFGMKEKVSDVWCFSSTWKCVLWFYYWKPLLKSEFFIGAVSSVYFRENWNSVILWNCSGHLFFPLLKERFIYLEGKVSERQKEKSSTCWFTFQVVPVARDRPIQSREPGTLRVSHISGRD